MASAVHDGAGMLVGPAALGLLVDTVSVRRALCANALLLSAAAAFFGATAREPAHLRPGGGPPGGGGEGSGGEGGGTGEAGGCAAAMGAGQGAGR